MRHFSFSPEAFEEYNNWAATDATVFKKIIELLHNAGRDPFKGLGKPEPLKNKYKGCWSRGITQDDRLIYKISDTEIFIVSCKGHY